MPTTLTPFADSEIRMRYQEPFLTEGLDLKLAVNTPPGVYRGFLLASSASALAVQVTADADNSDHSAVYQLSTGHSLTLRKTGGNFTLDLSAYAGMTVMLTIHASYVLGSDTSAEIRAYELSPSDEFTGASERPELVVLGKVVVPASGVIPAANITHDLRTSAWTTVAPEAIPWRPVLRNPSFEWASDTATARYGSVASWELISTSGGAWRANSGAGVPNTGTKALELNVTASPVTASALQRLEMPIAPGGRRLRLVLWVKSLIAPTVSALVNLALNWGDTTDADNGSPTLIPLVVVGATDTSYRQIDLIVDVPSPSGTAVAILKSVELRAAAQTYGATGVALRVDDVQVYVESLDAFDVRPDDARVDARQMAAAIIEDPSTLSAGQLASLLRFDKSTPTSEGELVIERKDQDYTGGKLPPALAPFGRILSLGSQLMGTAADARKARISAPYHNTFDITLIWESLPISGSHPGVRLYVSLSGLLFLTINAFYDGTNWNKDVAGTIATMWVLKDGYIEQYGMFADTPWASWTQISKMSVPQTPGLASQNFAPLLELFDSVGNRRVAYDYHGLRAGRVAEICQNWWGSSPDQWTDTATGAGQSATTGAFDPITYVPGCNGIGLAVSGAATGLSSIGTTFHPIGVVSGAIGKDSEIVLEWEAYSDCAGSEMTIMMGFVSTFDGGATNTGGAWIERLSGSDHWFLRTKTSGGTTFAVDTGVTMATPGDAVGADRFRLEMHGSNRPSGARVLAWINGVLVAEQIAGLPDTSMGLNFILSRPTATGVLQKLNISPVTLRIRRTPADDAL